MTASQFKTAPSPFLASVDASLLDRGEGAAGAGARARRRDLPHQARLF